jgi:hypothetical protein
MISDPQILTEKHNANFYASKRRNGVLWGMISGTVVVFVLLGTFLTLILSGVLVSPLNAWCEIERS